MANQWEAESTLFLFKTFWLTKLLLHAYRDIQGGFWKCRRDARQRPICCLLEVSENSSHIVTWTFLQQILFSRFMTSVFHGSKGCQFKSLVILVTPVQWIQTFPTDSFSSPVNGAWNWAPDAVVLSIIASIEPFLFMLDSDSSLKSFKLMLNCSRKRPFPVASAVTKLWQTKLFPINTQWFFLFLINKTGLAILLEYRVQTMGPRSRLHISKSTKIASRLQVPQIAILPTWIAHRSTEGAC